MTRFARASGSKASNERVPAEATPWAVMKEQLTTAKRDAETAKRREEAEKKRLENFESFLNEQKTMKRKVESWCDFPEQVSITKHNDGQEQHSEPKKRKHKHKRQEATEILETDTQFENNKLRNNTGEELSVVDEVALQADPKKNKSKKNKNNNNDPSPIEQENEIHSNSVFPDKKAKKNKKQKKENTDQGINDDSNVTLNGCSHENIKSPEKLNNKALKKQKQINKLANNTTSNDPHSNIGPHQKETHNQYPARRQKQKKETKVENGKAVRRKAYDDRSFQLIINGREVELVRYDGFPVMKRDAERLEELQKSMVSKGIPKSEVSRTMKLERRRAEKALARLKRDVCYNCRKGGHNLSDCPDLKSKVPEEGGGADGVCFKCGSTEHRQFECKVQRNQEFRFASCFICKEQGHIARQCPDNPKGLYPNGGGCNLCGDVTHLRKDCPTTTNEKEETSVRLETLTMTEDLEGITQPVTTTIGEPTSKKPKKVKF